MNCYNGETYLSESIKSVISQTYKNWELIFWDNKSIDKSAEIFKGFQDKRLRYFCAEEHATLYKARNLAIEKSNGDFIAFLDTDDLWESDKLSLQIKYFDNSQVGVVYGNCWILKKNKTKKIYIKQKLSSGKIFNQLIDNYNVGILTAMIRKTFYLNLKKKFDERFWIVGDFDLFMRLSKICKFQAIQKPIATYRLHEKNLTKLSKGKELEESEVWLKENKFELNASQINKLQKKVDNMKFVNYKIEGNYKDCIKMLFNPKKNLLSLRNLSLFFTPAFLLKRLLWFK